MIEISAVLTAHGEGTVAGPSLLSFEEAAAVATASGISVETIIVLDRPTNATKAQFANADERGHRIILTETGDPGGARNAGVEASRGRFVTFLDGDDLWSFNWLLAAYRFSNGNADAALHSEINVFFGLIKNVFFHVDSEGSYFDSGALCVMNYWDALVYAPRRTLITHPYIKNDLKRGFGHEDWLWNCMTLEAGIPHRPVPGTVHFKRRRSRSQLAVCATSDAIPHLNRTSSYDWHTARSTSQRQTSGQKK